MLFRDFTTLLDETAAGSGPLTGDTIALNPLPTDQVPNHAQEVVVVASGEFSGGAAPSLQIIVESSSDGETWITMWTASFGQSPFSGAGFPRVVATAVLDPSALFTFVRARTVPGGNTPPDQDRVKVQIGSTAPLRGRRVA